jgi:23S rRNA (pseudouridine1915-N3)-methyltransferase
LKLKILNIGRFKIQEYQTLFDYYLKLAAKYFSIEVVEIKDKSNLEVTFSSIEKYFANSFSIVLDEKGKSYTTMDFKDKLNILRDDQSEITFFIGNAFGFSNEVKSKADMLLSLSNLTLPHEMARVVLAEQIFRAGDILNNGKYHK